MRPRLRRWLRRLLWVALALLLGLVLLVGVAELWTQSCAASHCSGKAEDCPEGAVGLVLGCSKYMSRGHVSYYFSGRMDAAEKLWKSGRARCLIVSGDNRHRSYNEPRDMKNELIRRGIPAERIVCDFAGLRTYDSVVRAQRVFGVEKLAIISQPEHAQRAVAIARSRGMDAVGLEAPLGPLNRRSRLRQALRERAARVAMLFDLMLGHDPKHLGDPIALPE